MNEANELEDRLVEFAVRIMRLTEDLPSSRSANHVAAQLLRSGTSPAPNYAEARGAESRNDFIHKMKIALKELRETYVWLKIIKAKPLCNPDSVSDVLGECNELISIFVASVRTADKSRAPR